MTGRETQKYGTHLLRTEVEPAVGDGFWWRRRTGDRAESAFSPHPVSEVPAVSHETGAILWGIGDDHERWYHSTGEETLAAVLLAVEAPDDRAVAALSAAGQTLRALHDASAGTAIATRLSPRPRPLVRLVRWLDDRATTPLGARLRRNASFTIGETTLSRLRDRLTAVADPTALRLVHGAPGLGSIVLRPDGAVDVLTGEDAALGGPEFDVNWLLGEVTELSWLSGASDAWAPAVEAVLEGYGSDAELLDNDLIASRILLHAHDYVSYVRWDENAQEQYVRFVAHLTGGSR